MQSARNHIWGAVLRISEDPNDEQRGVLRQKKDAIEEVAKRGGDPDQIRWFVENDTSAWKQKRVRMTDVNGNEYDAWRVIRPVWHQALQALREKEITALAVWDLDRLARDQRDLADAVEVVKYHGAYIVSSTASSIDLTTDSGVAMAQVMVAMAAKQSADTARRVKREHRDAAEQGIPRGGIRPFGFEKDKVTHKADEVEVIREVAQKIIDGLSLNSITRELKERGVTTPYGKEFVSQSLRTMVLNARYAGWRTDKNRQIVFDKNGQPVRGLWEPVLDQETYDKVRAVLTDPKRVNRGAGSRKGQRKYLLSGLLKCGVCGGVLYGNPSGVGRPYYACRAERGDKHGLTCSMQTVDAIVSAQVGLRVTEQTPVEVDLGAPTFTGDARLEEIDELVREAMAQMRETPSLSKVIYAHVSALEEERVEIEKDRSQWLLETTGPALISMTPEEWGALSTEARRTHIDNHLEAVVIRPSERRSPKFDPSRIVYVWR